MKGILLAGGTGSRLYPITKGLSKQLLPVYNKPLIYYSLSTLMLAEIRDILLITNPEFVESYKNLLGDGSRFGITITYKPQKSPRGIAEAFVIGEEFIGDDSVCLVLGDNIFYGHDLPQMLADGRQKIADGAGAVIFAHKVSKPCEYGVVEFDKKKKIISLEEKPKNPKSDYAVVGLYMYDSSVVAAAKEIEFSDRGELEITDVNRLYLNEKRLNLQIFGRGYAWLDAGNCDDLFRASVFVHAVEKRQGFKIACLEEIAFYMGFITEEQLRQNYHDLSNSEYGEYLARLSDNEIYVGTT